MVHISSWKVGEVVLSDNSIIKGSFILSDEGEVLSLKTTMDLQLFLDNQQNFTFIERFKNKEILIVGCGHDFLIPSFNVRKYINSFGLKLEWVITQSAMGTFNILRDEDRSCFMLLINNPV